MPPTETSSQVSPDYEMSAGVVTESFLGPGSSGTLDDELLAHVLEDVDDTPQGHDLVVGAYLTEVVGHVQRLGTGLLHVTWGRSRACGPADREGLVVMFPHAPSSEELEAIGTEFAGVPVYPEITG